MMGVYEASVPVFTRYLERLLVLIDRAEDYAQAQKVSERSILEARLIQDMLPFQLQVLIAANFALRTCFPLAGLAVPEYVKPSDSFADLRSGIRGVMEQLGALKSEAFDTNPFRLIQDKAGEMVVSLTALDFLLQYALPNFFFHCTTAYNILRHLGVPLSKAHFDGFHVCSN